MMWMGSEWRMYKTEQVRASQSKSEQVRASQSKSEQVRASQSKSEQVRDSQSSEQVRESQSSEQVGESQSKSEQCMDRPHCLHWLHFEPTHLLYYHTVCTDYSWSPLTVSCWHARLPVVLCVGAVVVLRAAGELAGSGLDPTDRIGRISGGIR
jgi:hypothetical protein